MGVFTRLDDAEVVDITRAFDLGTLIAYEPIAAGTINSNFVVATDRGHWFVRVNEGKAEVDVAWEARLIAALATSGFPTPPPIIARDARPYAALPHVLGKWVSVFPWRAGRHLAPLDVTLAIADALGATLGELHRLGLELPASWRRGSIYDHDHLVARYACFADDIDPALAHAIEMLRDELAVATDAIPLRQQATHGIIHGDLFRDNVLWQDGRVAAVLDFEQASGDGKLRWEGLRIRTVRRWPRRTRGETCAAPAGRRSIASGSRWISRASGPTSAGCASLVTTSRGSAVRSIASASR